MSEYFSPWEFHPALTAERLRGIGSIIRDVRREVVQTHEPSKGDDPWVLGCRGYRRTCFALSEAAKSGLFGLSIKDGDHLRFVFSIGDSPPLRFYRGEPEEPPSRTLRRTFPELRWVQLRLQFGEQPVEGLLRLAVELQENGELALVTLILVDEAGTVLNKYGIRLGEHPATVEAEQIVSFPSTRKEGVEVPAPPVLDLDDAQATESDDE